LVDLLKNKAVHLNDILTLEKELSRVRGEVEEIEGRLHFLANQADLYTVKITLQEVKEFLPQGSPSLGTRVGRSFTGSVDGLKEFGEGAIVAVVAIVPWMLPLGLVVWLAWKLANRKPNTPPVAPNPGAVSGPGQFGG
jgi:hypothetical protein